MHSNLALRETILGRAHGRLFNNILKTGIRHVALQNAGNMVDHSYCEVRT